MLSYKEQSSDSLKLFVGKNIFAKEDHTVVQRSSFSAGFFEVTFGILAESHFVSIKHSKFQMDELCICTDIIIPGSESLRLSEIGSKDIIMDEDAYLYTFRTEHLRNGEAQAKCQTLFSKRNKLETYHLEHVFPTAEASQPNALTGIYITIDDGLLIESVHTYPEEDVEVFTQSKLTLK